MSKHAEMAPVEQRKVLDTARALAKEFDRAGAEADAKNEFPMHLVPLYKDSGLIGLLVPKEFGGLGGDIWTATQVAMELAKGDPACSLAFNMHQQTVGLLGSLMADRAKRYWLPRIAEEKLLACGLTSEERAGATGLADTAAVPARTGGWTVRGKKTWGTLSQAADIMMFNATITDETGTVPASFQEHMSAESLFVLSMQTPGIKISKTWDAMGMRATGTQTVTFENVNVPFEARVCDFRTGALSHFEWIGMAFAGVYHGLVEKAYEATRQILLKKSLGKTPEGEITLREQGFVQAALGRMLVRKEISARTLEATARMLLDGRDGAWHMFARPAMIEVAKVCSTHAAIEMVDDGMRLVGGSSFRRGHILERLYRDARSGPFHPFTTDFVYNHLGKLELGMSPMGGPPPKGGGM